MVAEQPVTPHDLVVLAKCNGLSLTEAEAAELLPSYVQMQGWLARLRQVVDDQEEPAICFSAREGTDNGA
jgi:hypothetical protein